MDYEYAKTLPSVEIEMLMEVINDQRKAEAAAMKSAQSG